MIASFLAGKAYSYGLNAIYDAQDAEYLLTHLDAKSGPNRRINEIATQYPNRIERAMAAYALKYINGYMDYAFAVIILRLISQSMPDLHREYKDEAITLKQLISCWAYPLVGNTHHLQIKLTPHIQIKKIKPKDVIDSIYAIQQINRRLNSRTIKAFYQPDKNHKVSQLHQLANKHKHPGVFLYSAKTTQSAASFWDLVYMLFLRLSRFAHT